MNALLHLLAAPFRILGERLRAPLCPYCRLRSRYMADHLYFDHAGGQ